MTVFDRGGFIERAKLDRLSSPKPSQKPIKRDDPSNKDWKEGFEDGYQAAIDRYIPAYKG